MRVLIVSYMDDPGYWADVLCYHEIAASIESGSNFHPQIISLPSCANYKSEARAQRANALTVYVFWDSQSKINITNEINPGVMILTWNNQKDVLVTEPAAIKWDRDDGELWYPTWSLIQIS